MSRRLYHTEIRVLAAVLAFVALLLCVLIVQTLGDLTMKILILAAAAVALSGCASGAGKAVLDDLQGCERHYNGVISAGTLQPASFSGSVKIDCPTAKAPAPALAVGDVVAPPPNP